MVRVGVVGEVGGDLDRHAAVEAAGRVVDGTEDVGRVAHVVGRDLEDRRVDVGAGRGELVHLRVRRRRPCASAPAKIVGFVVTPTTLRSAISSLEVAGGDALARQVVEPDAHAGFGERGGGGVGAHGDVSPSCARQADASVSFAAATTASAVMPNSRNRVL